MFNAETTKLNRTVSLFLGNFLFRDWTCRRKPMHLENCHGCFVRRVSRWSGSPEEGGTTLSVGFSFEKKDTMRGDAMIRSLDFLPVCGFLVMRATEEF